MSESKYYAIYCRVSSEEQANRKEGSLVSQQERTLQYLKFKFGENVPHKVYIDEAKTGRNTERTQYQAMIQDIKASKIMGIVATELTRLSRSMKDLLELVEICKKNNVIFISLKENFDTSSAIGILLFQFFAALAQYESALIAERVHNNAISRKRRGLFVGRSLPFGYCRIPQKPGYLAIDENNASIVRLIYDQFLEQGSYSLLAKWLNKNNILHNGHPWRKTSVLRILTNPHYISQICFEGKIIPAVWDPLIPLEKWNAVQAYLRENHHKRKHSQHVFTVANIAYCSHCNCSLIATSGTSKHKKLYYYYRHSGPRLKTCPFLGTQKFAFLFTYNKFFRKSQAQNLSE